MRKYSDFFETDEQKMNKLENDKIVAEENLRNMTNNIRSNLRAMDNEINRLSNKINQNQNVDNTPKRVTSNPNLGGKKW